MGMTARLIRLLWRLLPVLVLIYAFRDGAESSRRLFKTLREVTHIASVYVELYGVGQVLYLDAVNGEPLPDDFQAYMRKHLESPTKETGLDPWGQPYQVVERDNALVLFSCGPDQACDTEDDVRYRIDVAARR